MNKIWASLLPILLLCCTIAHATDWGPWEISDRQEKKRQDRSAVLPVLIGLFQKYISPVDGQRCAMYPTCSAYSVQAIHRHGALLGTFITVDRLFREGDPGERQVRISKWGYLRFHDPLADNDFWLASRNVHTR